MKLNLCFSQFRSVMEEPEKNLLRAEGMIEEASCRNSDIIIFPEQAFTGWDPLSRRNVEDEDGLTVSSLREYAEEYSVGILGSYRRKTDTIPENTALLIGDDGDIVASYSKIHLFTPGREGEAFRAGSNPAVADYKGVKTGIAICYDLRFPELFAYYRKCGAEIVFVPAAWPCRRMNYWRLFLHARAADNRFFVAGINTTGENHVDTYCGGSVLIDPCGETVANAGGGEGLTFTSADTSAVSGAENILPVFPDRKEELYIKWLR
ncbi:nitrilase-related carbon-nitrogen hydrolase [Methanoplanus endosymbiosus]|uniref:Carbon-nitrogen hydrolase family protein n=1 Tax=Methanoplanus endosymbiosus TaxID=33865 RepID=A0A9E7PPS1_9EURY|nr:nitrilase-related carbon-nitrogen hydrolase [Methanoplanus endosymbiosus]UUX91357.1 carbon-nitrogen hydrolase family protein [Methanoplanus endosymbiosus]